MARARPSRSERGTPEAPRPHERVVPSRCVAVLSAARREPMRGFRESETTSGAGDGTQRTRTGKRRILKQLRKGTDLCYRTRRLDDALSNRPSPASTQSPLRKRRDGSEEAQGHAVLRAQAAWVALAPLEWSVANAASGWAERQGSSRAATLLGRSVSPATCEHVASSRRPKQSLKTAAMPRSSGAAFFSTGGGVVGTTENHLARRSQQDFRTGTPLAERHRGIRACTTKQPCAGLTRSRPGPTLLRGMQWRGPMVRFIASGQGWKRYKGGTSLAFFPAGSCRQRREARRPDSSTACSGAGSTRSMAGRVPYSQKSCSCCGRTSPNLSLLEQ